MWEKSPLPLRVGKWKGEGRGWCPPLRGEAHGGGEGWCLPERRTNRGRKEWCLPLSGERGKTHGGWRKGLLSLFV